MNDKNQQVRDLKNADMLTWRVMNYQRGRKEAQIRKILGAREHDRYPTHH